MANKNVYFIVLTRQAITEVFKSINPKIETPDPKLNNIGIYYYEQSVVFDQLGLLLPYSFTTSQGETSGEILVPYRYLITYFKYEVEEENFSGKIGF